MGTSIKAGEDAAHTLQGTTDWATRFGWSANNNDGCRDTTGARGVHWLGVCNSCNSGCAVRGAGCATHGTRWREPFIGRYNRQRGKYSGTHVNGPGEPLGVGNSSGWILDILLTNSCGGREPANM